MMKTLHSLVDGPAEVRQRHAWLLLRVTLALLIAIHGWARLVAGAVPPFGQFLDSQGFPFGLAWAAAVTALEIGGSLALAAGRFVRPLCALYAAVYAMGIVLVHAKAGWFVVGLGRNGAEYSVLLIVCLLCVGWQQAGSGRAAPRVSAPTPAGDPRHG